MHITDKQIAAFQKEVLNYYKQHARQLPWRMRISPYRVWVSEIMLQQTGVARVADKFQEFMKRFPTVHALANAPLVDVLAVWSGLGYNRRAKFLHQAAQGLAKSKRFPRTVEQWHMLPGVGYATAAAIMVYAYNSPEVYIETNIRTVFLHSFFSDKENVSDQELLPLIERAVAGQEPRVWYSALMDYGSFIKSRFGNPNRKSKHHVRQKAFAGSVRQVRGAVIKYLLAGPASIKVLRASIPDERLPSVVHQLVSEGMVQKQGTVFFIS